MFLWLAITILCCLQAFAHALAQPVKKALLKRPIQQDKQWLSEIEDLKLQLSTISMRDDYTGYVKIERKIVMLEQKISSRRTSSLEKDLLINYGTGYCIQFLISFILMIISLTYRNVPVIVYDDKFNFAPFGGIMKFPTGIDGAISVPIWSFVSVFTFRTIAGYLKL